MTTASSTCRCAAETLASADVTELFAISSCGRRSARSFGGFVPVASYSLRATYVAFFAFHRARRAALSASSAAASSATYRLFSMVMRVVPASTRSPARALSRTSVTRPDTAARSSADHRGRISAKDVTSTVAGPTATFSIVTSCTGGGAFAASTSAVSSATVRKTATAPRMQRARATHGHRLFGASLAVGGVGDACVSFSKVSVILYSRLDQVFRPTTRGLSHTLIKRTFVLLYMQRKDPVQAKSSVALQMQETKHRGGAAEAPASPEPDKTSFAGETNDQTGMASQDPPSGLIPTLLLAPRSHAGTAGRPDRSPVHQVPPRSAAPHRLPRRWVPAPRRHRSRARF